MMTFSSFGRVLWTTMVLVGLAAAPAAASGSGSAADEAIPDADDSLTRAELQWCIVEPVRLAGDNAETDDGEKWEVDDYNSRVGAYNDRCSNKTYRLKDKTAVESALTPEGRQELRQSGIARVRQARIEREQRRVFVKDRTAIIRSLPSSAGEELGQVPRWGDLIRTGRVQGPWYEVEGRNPRLETALELGWVLGGLVESGSGTKARFDYCEQHAGGRARHNEIVSGRTEPDRIGSIRVENETGKEAYVKLLNGQGKTSLAFLVGAEQTAVLKGIPLGSYEVVFATGSMFSRGCNSFSKPGSAARFEQRIDYHADSGGWTLSLNNVSGGHARATAMGYDDFDRL